MKAFIFFFIAALSCFSLKAQEITLAVSAAADTITTGNSPQTITATVSSKAKAVGIQLVVAESAAGTLAGTATLQCSTDGTNWVTVPGAAVYTITDTALQSTVWSVTHAFKRYRILIAVTGGTASPTARVFVN